ncbi:major_cap_HK97, phage major capsid protein, HK97 family [uncultured Caudovirales phage]|jgi:HK97 family phage major capsid protein|uniref:Major_cap_HK97, phage major capsid protein, HK97 family n=1 Tax=uncultured Caudovirales phage TaxID=2100421 RepID=A0A6J5M9K7_9CAUD|nr:major_cap_HK97, phage major capsid protein, HK97 family [uncultured Caudovirales phage]
MKNIKALKEERGHLLDELAGLQTVIEREARSMSELETNRLNDIEARLSSIANEVEKLDKLQNLAAQAAGNSVSRSEEKEKSKMKDQYSFKRAMEMAISGRRDGVEGEFNAIAAEEYQRSGVSVSAHSIKIPSEVFKRDMTATGGSPAGAEGGYNIQTSVGSIIDVLLPRTVLRGLGVQQLSNLVGNLDLPTASTLPSAGWNTENGSATEKSPAFSKVTFSPKRLAAYIQVSNQLMLQSSNSIDAYVRNWLLQAMAQSMEAAAIKGGGSNEPTGIIANANVNVVFAGGATSNATNANGAAPVWADVVNLMKAVENANGEGVAYLTNPLVKAKLQTTPRQSSGVEGNFIWPAGGSELNGYPVATSTLVPSNLSKGTSSTLSAAIFGDFSKMALASWGGMELTVDPYSGATAGLTNVVLNAYMDCNLLQPAAFAVCKDIVA